MIWNFCVFRNLYLPWSPKDILLYFLRVFKVLKNLILKILIHLDILFLYGVRQASSFIISIQITNCLSISYSRDHPCLSWSGMPPWAFHLLENQESRSEHGGGSIRFQLWVQATGNLKSWREGGKEGWDRGSSRKEGVGWGQPVSIRVWSPSPAWAGAYDYLF